MNLIVAVDAEWGIGKNNDLLYSIPEDMKFFRSTTLDKVVVMGRKTLESFPGGNPLKKRVNIVITSNKDYDAKGAIVVTNLEELDKALEGYNPDDIFCIGGASVYKLLLDRCNKAYVTKMFSTFGATSFFPNLDEKSDWNLIETGEMKEYEGIKYQFCVYTK